MLATMNRAWSASVWGWSALRAGACAADVSAVASTPEASRTDCVRTAMTALDRSWARAWSGRSLTWIVPGPDRSAGALTTAATVPSSRAAAALAASGNVVISIW